MNVIDILLMVLILAGALYLLYHSLWKNKGHCVGSGCCSGSSSCGSDKASDCHADTAGKEPMNERTQD
jgi:hypothetical protein